jgi:hypothetical protein
MKTKKALSDVSMFEAYGVEEIIEQGTRVICVSDKDMEVNKGSYGVTTERHDMPSVRWENEDYSVDVDDSADFSVLSKFLAPFPDELYNKLVLGVDDVVKEDERVLELEKQLAAGWKENDVLKDDVKVLVHLLRCSIEFKLTETDTHLAKLLIAKYTPRKQYTLEQLREKIGEDFDIVNYTEKSFNAFVSHSLVDLKDVANNPSIVEKMINSIDKH